MTIDLSRAPRGELAATALVEAVAAGDDRLERHYLEVKGPLDLRNRVEAAKVAKFVLGAANRLPETAATAFEGYAAMVIGVTPGQITGMPPIEVMDIARALERYIGVPGVAPAWDIVRVPAASTPNEVIVIVVGPPVVGGLPFICRHDGDHLFDGAIYVRADGATRQANSSELDQKLARAIEGAKPAADFEVNIAYTPSPMRIDVDSAVAAYMSAMHEYLVAHKDSVEPRPFSEWNSIYGLGGAWLTEDRSYDEYRGEIAAWQGSVRESITNSLPSLAGNLLPAVVVAVANKVDTFFHDVQVKIHLNGEIMAAEYVPAKLFSELDLGLPSPPRRWGRRPNPDYSFPLTMGPQQFLPTTSIPSFASSRTTWRNSGSVDLTLDIGDLRPRESVRVDDEEFVLFLPPGSVTGAIQGLWEITARGHNQVFTGSPSMEPGKVSDVTAMVSESLRRRLPSDAYSAGPDDS